MKKYAFAVIIVGMILGFLTGIYLYKINQIDNTKISKVETQENNNINVLPNTQQLSNTVETNVNEEKISPNCVLKLKIYYDKCNHLIEKKQTIAESEVNMTEQELKENFKDWEIQKFTPSEIVLYKEEDDFCGEHYLLKENNGYIAIYKLDENDNAKLLETTEISTMYLTEQDLENIRVGIKVFTTKELNKTIEDFE